MSDGNFYAKLLVRLLGEERFLLTTHRGPDPDGLGAELALDYFLRARGKDSIIYNHDAINPRYHFLDTEKRVRHAGESIDPSELEGRTVVMLDNSDLDRSGDAGRYINADKKNLIVIDHHDGIASDYHTFFLNAGAGSTSEMIFYLIEQAGVRLTPEVAQAIYAGIVPATGHFRYQKTKPRTHLIAAKLLEAGVDTAKVGDKLFATWATERLWGRAKLYESLRVDEERQMAWFAVRRRQLDEVSCSFEDLDGILNELIEPSDILAGILFTEREAGRTKVSLRSKGDVNLLPAVNRYGGGGHRNACGGTIPLDLEAAIQQFIPLVAECVRASGDARK